MDSYVVELRYDGSEEPFEVNGDNVASVRIFDERGNDITYGNRVMLEFSRNGLIGFATELIRWAHRYKDGMHTHIYPLEKDQIVQRMGVYLNPKSAELIVGCNDFEPIHDQLEKVKE